MKMQARKIGPVRAAILSWFGVPGVDYTQGYEAVVSPSGEKLTDDSVLTIATVWACVRLISETIATLPLSMYERQGKGKQFAPDHPLHVLIHDQPNKDSIAAVFWEAVISAMLLRGNAYVEKQLYAGSVKALRFLDPVRLTITQDGNGNPKYSYAENGKPRDIPASSIWHIPGYSLDGVLGVSVIRYGAGVFGNALAADTAAGGTFKNGLLPRLWFKYPKTLSPTQREQARDYTINRLAGAVNSGKPAILENEMEVGSVGINPSDAQLLESRDFSVAEICRWFRVPPYMVGHSGNATNWGTGIEQQMIGFLTFTLAPWLKRIEQSISKDLLGPGERQKYYAKYSVEGLLRADSKGRADYYASLADHAIMTRDEIRELEDLEPMGGNAGKLTLQAAMTLLDAIGKPNEPTDQTAAPGPGSVEQPDSRSRG